MHRSRRRFLRTGHSALTAIAATALWPLRALADALEGAFKAKTLDEAFKELGSTPATSADIQITTPDIAENGAVVPVTVVSAVPKTEQIMILIEKNPNPLAAVFTIPDGTEAFVSTRVKVAQTCNLIAVVKADGKLYSAMRETKVTLGGCGG
jgi:sulfur-oxidizing protein SoxY